LDPYLSKSCGYGPLTNLNTKQPPMFWFFSSFGPPRQKKNKKLTRGTSLRVPRQRWPSQQWTGGPKLPKNQNIGGCFVFKLVRGP